MPRSHTYGSPCRFYYGLNLTDGPGNAYFRSRIRMHYIYVCLSTTTYDNGCNTESHGPIRIATNDAGLYPWLIRRPVRECVTWALDTCDFPGCEAVRNALNPPMKLVLIFIFVKFAYSNRCWCTLIASLNLKSCRYFQFDYMAHLK